MPGSHDRDRSYPNVRSATTETSSSTAISPDGIERWYFTDDQHLIWRIHNQYLMSLFEGGLLGLACLHCCSPRLPSLALCARWRSGNRMAAAVAASLLAFLCSSVFDCLLEAPRLSALFYIVAFTGLTMMTRVRAGLSHERGTRRCWPAAPKEHPSGGIR